MSDVPLYRRVCERIRGRIRSGTYPRGAALPSETQLTQDYGVSLITVRHALRELELDGLVERRQGIGTFVRDQPRNVIISMSSFTSDVAGGRLRLVRTLLADDMMPASPELAERLGVQTGSMLRHLVRLDSEGLVPLSVDEAFMPPELATRITREIASSPLFMHLWQRESGIALVRTDYDIGVEMPGKADQEVLGIGPDIPLLVTGELIFDMDGNASAYIVTRYRGDRCRLFGNVALVQKTTEHGVIGE